MNIIEQLKQRFANDEEGDVAKIVPLFRGEFEELIAFTEALQKDNEKLQDQLDSWRQDAMKGHHHDQSSEEYLGYR